MREIIIFAASLGAAPDIGTDARIDMTRGMTDFRTSTLRAIEAGRPVEIATRTDVPCATARLVQSAVRHRDPANAT